MAKYRRSIVKSKGKRVNTGCYAPRICRKEGCGKWFKPKTKYQRHCEAHTRDTKRGMYRVSEKERQEILKEYELV